MILGINVPEVLTQDAARLVTEAGYADYRIAFQLALRLGEDKKKWYKCVKKGIKPLF
ncbi:MAG TPA: hypothetical protein VHZ50_11010 [Puia sp.]|jgi:hypothetical protein|nr:hypothetical protein [Puia sp.]